MSNPLFHTTANLGIERETPLLDEYLRVPFPLPEQTRNPAESRDIVQKVAKRLRVARTALGDSFHLAEKRARIIADAKAETTALVFQYYELAAWEQQIVRDTVEVSKPSATPASLTIDIPTLRRTDRPDQNCHRDYAVQLCRTINRCGATPTVEARRERAHLQSPGARPAHAFVERLSLRLTKKSPLAQNSTASSTDFKKPRSANTVNSLFCADLL